MLVYLTKGCHGWDFLNPCAPEGFSYKRDILDGKVDVKDWVPLAVRREERSLARSPRLRVSDSPWFHGANLVLTETARDRTESLLAPWGVFLPLDCAGEVLYFFLPTAVIPALDHEASEIEYFRDSKRVMAVRRYVFDPTVIGDHQMFRLPERRRTDLFVTEGFREAWLATGVTGVGFEKVWSDDPTDPGPFHDDFNLV